MGLTFSIHGPDGTLIARGWIHNDGTGTKALGNYDVGVSQPDGEGRMRRRSFRVSGYRRSRGAERLVSRVLDLAARPAPPAGEG